MAIFRMRPMIVDAVTFDELIDYGREHSEIIYNNKPWYFIYKGIPVVHETDNCYLIGGTESFTRDKLLIMKDRDITVVDIDAFEQISDAIG